MASVLGDDIDILAKAKRALPPDYAPSDAEEYMSKEQLNYFRVLLLEWKKSILIDSALRRLDDGEYGWCEVTGEPIGINRLIARPIATMTVEAQQAHERREKVSRDN